MFKNMKLSVRLAMGFSVVLVLMAVIIIVTIVSLANIQSSVSQIVNENVYKLNLYEDMSKCSYEVIGNLKDMMMTEDRTKIDGWKKEVQDYRAKYDEDWAAIQKTAASEAAMELRRKVDQNKTAARDINNRVVELIDANNRTEAVKLFINEANPANDAWIASINEQVQMQNTNNTEDAQNATATNQRTMLITIILGVFTIIAGVLVAIFITRSITKPVKKIVVNLTEGAQQVAAASGQLSSTSQQLAEGNAEQASSIEETSSTLEESASMVRQNSENTRQAALLAAQTKASSDKGNNDMLEMMNSIGEIKKSSDQIAKIIKVIDDIAFQTNILALNAAVEAARAGDAGMGFAVVAEEVRNLAQRSAQAAKDTASIIESNITLSENGVNVAKKVGESLAEIAVQAKKVNELMDEVAAASQEQSQGISQINKAISQMEAVTQQNAANAEESASASEELNAQAENLRGIVQDLVVLVDGKSAEVNTSGYMDKNGPGTKSGSQLRSKTSNSFHTGLAGQKPGSRALEVRNTHLANPEEVIPLNETNVEF